MEDLLSTGVTADETLLQGILDEIEGVLENDVGAVVAYDGSRTRSDDAIKANSLKMSSYNRLGQKIRQWTIYGLTGAPATRISYSYNVSGELASTETAEWKDGSWSPVSALAYSYDPHGRLKAVLENGDSLMRIDRTTSGTLSKKAYFDKGAHVYDMTYGTDIYGRTTHLDYKDADGKILYSEIATYPSVVTGRLSSAEHIWDGRSSSETFSYDKLGRLTGFRSDNGLIGEGSYTYDALGRLLSKSEGAVGKDTTINYVYGDAAFKPLEMNIAYTGAAAYYAYDASGNVWLDRHSGNAYTLNAFGLPDKVRKLEGCTADVSFDDVNSDAILDCEVGRTVMAYDEGGQRIWTDFRVGAPAYRKKVSYPGFGEYTLLSNHPSDALELTRIDLLGGGFRAGLTGVAQFPVKDLQGSVRSAHAYYPYGSVEDLSNDAPEDARRWQSKEFDGDLGNYYFGARYYDPLLGMWMSPDPAGQFSNPYSYGGDPVNYVDPTGLWAIGPGFVVGWDEQHGWRFGPGFAFDIGSSDGKEGIGFNFSYTWNQDGSRSFTTSLSAQAQIEAININMGLSYSNNTYTGSITSEDVGVCIGNPGFVCAGASIGSSLYWDQSGFFMGQSIYAEFQATAAGGLARANYGYETALGIGVQGHGVFAGYTVAGIYGEWSELNGYSQGFAMQVNLSVGGARGQMAANGMQEKVQLEIWLSFLGIFGHIGIGTYDTSKPGLRAALQGELLELLKYYKDQNDPIAELWYKAIKEQGPNLSVDILNDLMTYLDKKGCQTMTLTWPFDWSTTTDKRVIWKEGQIGYPHMEYKYNQNGSGAAYSSYNYGSDLVTHLLIDFAGYYIPRFLSGAND